MIFAGPLLGYLGFCWRLLGLEFQVQPKHGSVEVEFLGRLRAHVGPLGGYVGPLLAHLGVCWGLSGLKFQSQPNMVRLGLNFGSVSGLCWAIWKVCWAYVGPLLAHLGVCWRLSGLRFNSQRFFFVEG